MKFLMMIAIVLLSQGANAQILPHGKFIASHCAVDEGVRVCIGRIVHGAAAIALFSSGNYTEVYEILDSKVTGTSSTKIASSMRLQRAGAIDSRGIVIRTPGQQLVFVASRVSNRKDGFPLILKFTTPTGIEINATGFEYLFM